MWLGLVIFTLVAYVEANGNMTQCPNGCYCQVASFDCTSIVDVELSTPTRNNCLISWTRC